MSNPRNTKFICPKCKGRIYAVSANKPYKPFGISQKTIPYKYCWKCKIMYKIEITIKATKIEPQNIKK